MRQFSPQPIPEEAINDILEVARWTGSGMNRQPWEFVLVRDRDTLRQIAEEEGAGSYLPGASCAILIVMTGESQAIETYDEGRLTERMMLAAAARGVAVGIWWIKDDRKAGRCILGIPEGRLVRTAIYCGYQDEAAASRPKKRDARKPLSELVHEEGY